MRIFKQRISPFLFVFILTFGIVIPMSSEKTNTNSNNPVTYLYTADEKKSLENLSFFQ